MLAPSQDLNSGTVRLMILPGYVRETKLTPDSDYPLWLYSAFPARAGNLPDLRDIEQGLENLRHNYHQMLAGSNQGIITTAVKAKASICNSAASCTAMGEYVARQM